VQNRGLAEDRYRGRACGRYPCPATFGTGGYLATSRRAIATTIVSSLQTIIDSIGPVDGLDWDIEGGDLYPAEMIWIGS
jgi:hypothetical protein